MTNKQALKASLTELADAIREKTGGGSPKPR